MRGRTLPKMLEWQIHNRLSELAEELEQCNVGLVFLVSLSPPYPSESHATCTLGEGTSDAYVGGARIEPAA